MLFCTHNKVLVGLPTHQLHQLKESFLLLVNLSM